MKLKPISQPAFANGRYAHLPLASLKRATGVLIPRPKTRSAFLNLRSHVFSTGQRLSRKFTVRAAPDGKRVYVGRVK